MITGLSSFWTHPVVVSSSWVELLGTLALISFIAGLYKHLECHVSTCHRLGRFTPGHYQLCHVHHPGVPSDGKITIEHIKATVGKAVVEKVAPEAESHQAST